ncbi:MAG: DUF433 domain-containing protein [Gemmataceae bacterium]
MSVEDLEHYSKDQLIEELINRQTFVGIVIFHCGDAKAGSLDAGETVMAKSPPLTREGVENLLRVGQSLVSALFVEGSAPSAEGRVDAFPFHADRFPLRADHGGAVRVGNSRISVDVIVQQYENGMTPEDMVRAYDTLVLADVYAVIAYYLRHRDEVRTYLKRREDEAEALRMRIEAERPGVSREELLARRSAREKADAPIGQ